MVFVAASSAYAQPPFAPTPEGRSQLGFASPAAAMAALRARPNVLFSEQRGWTIAEEPAARIIWSFAPSGHPAYPAVVRRRVVQRNGSVLIHTDVMCGSTKLNCDALVRDFQHLNDAVERGFH